MKKIAVFPGSFDPITRGHESVIRRALPLFDEVYVAIGMNAEKEGFSVKDLRDLYENLDELEEIKDDLKEYLKDCEKILDRCDEWE